MASKRLAILAVVLTVALAGAAFAQGTSGAQFLGVGVGARAVGMGGAFVSVADDGTALHWNPAGLTQAAGHRLTLSHVSWLSDATYQYAGYVAPLGSDAAVGAALEQGSVSWDNTGEGSFDSGDFAAAFGYGRRLRPNLGVGADIKFVSSTLGDAEASSYALDLGVVYRLSGSARIGAVVRNLGPGLTFESESDPLPATFVVGGSYRWRDVLLSADLEKVNDIGATARLGAEYTPAANLALRGGWIVGEDGALSSVTGGVGVNWSDVWALDYAYRSSDIGGTHQFALSAGFGAAEGLAAPPASAAEGGVELSSVPKSNIAVISELIREVMKEAVDKMSLPPGAEVHLRQVDTHDANWLVKSIMLEELTSRGHVVRAGQMTAVPDATDSNVFEIAYRIVSCQTTLPRAWREWIVGPRKLERRTDVDVRFELSNQTKAIIWAGGVQREKREIIPGSRLGDLEAPGQSFASPEAEPGGWDKVFEPVIVAGIVGGLIYLFYSSRSTD